MAKMTTSTLAEIIKTGAPGDFHLLPPDMQKHVYTFSRHVRRYETSKCLRTGKIQLKLGEFINHQEEAAKRAAAAAATVSAPAEVQA